MIAAILLVGILGALALLHFRWALGAGTSASASGLIPSVNGKPLFSPGPLACVVVGGLLSLAALICAVRAGWLLQALPAWLSQTGVWGLAVVFALRAIGDFRYVGFFKRVRGSLFARRDSLYYSPLCVGIALLAARLALW